MKYINIKKNVVFHPETWKRSEMWAIVFVIKLTASIGYTPTITGGVEGRHSTNPWSKHYTGWAIDIRINDFPEDVKRWVSQIKNKLGPDYFVLLEDNHIHIHYIKGE